ncbi:MAG: hypothetical protein EOO20_02855 [Chryseobacterium sp.]|nr:MAG: hypothetical protein EOO20_02855 [Chryseobacterium sp.]
MSSKRVKFSFNTISVGKIAEIDRADLASSSQRIKIEMKAVIRKYKMNEIGSVKDAKRLVLNA